MNEYDIISLGLGIQAPWKIVGQILDAKKRPHELRIRIEADRGSKYPCPICSTMCNAHDFKEKTWRHLNFFSASLLYHCEGTKDKVSRARDKDSKGTMGEKRQQVHIAV